VENGRSHVEIHYNSINLYPASQRHHIDLFSMYFNFRPGGCCPGRRVDISYYPQSPVTRRVNQMTHKLFCRKGFFLLAQQLLYSG
jgi:hypothetical protein